VRTIISILFAFAIFPAIGQGVVRRVPTLEKLLLINPYSSGTGDSAVYEIESRSTNASWGDPRYVVWSARTNYTANGTNVFASQFGGQWVFLDKDAPIQDARWWGFTNLWSLDQLGNLTLGTTNVAGKLASLDADVQNRAYLVHLHDAADVASGIFSPLRLGSGVPDTNSFLRGDGAWAMITTNGTSSSGGTNGILVNGISATNIIDGTYIKWGPVGQSFYPYIITNAHIRGAFLPDALVGTNLTALNLGQDNGPYGLSYEVLGRNTVGGRVIAMDADKARTVLDAASAGHTHMTFGDLLITGNLYLNTLNLLTKLSEIDFDMARRQVGSVALTNAAQDYPANTFFAGDHAYRTVTTNAIPGLVSDIANLNARLVTVNGSAVTNFYEPSEVSLYRTNQVGWRVIGKQASAYIKDFSLINQAAIRSPKIYIPFQGSGFTSEYGPNGTNIHLLYYEDSFGWTNIVESVDINTLVTKAGIAKTANVLPIIGGTITGNLTVVSNLTSTTLTLGGSSRTDWNQLQTASSILTNIQSGSDPTLFWSADHTYRSVTTNSIPGLVTDLAALNQHQFFVEGQAVTNVHDFTGGANIAWNVTGQQANPYVRTGAILQLPDLISPSVLSPIDRSGFGTVLGTVGPSSTFIPFYLSASPDTYQAPLKAVDLGTVITNLGLAYGANYLPISGGNLTGTLQIGLSPHTGANLISYNYTALFDTEIDGPFLALSTSRFGGSVTNEANVTMRANLTLGGATRSSFDQLQTGNIILTNVLANDATNAFWAGDHTYRIVTTNMIPGLTGMFGKDIDASNIVSGYVSPDRLGSGSATTNSFLRGDGQWATIATNTSSSSLATNAVFVNGNYVTNLVDGPNVTWAISGQRALPFVPSGVSITNLTAANLLTVGADLTSTNGTTKLGATQINALSAKAGVQALDASGTPYIPFFTGDPSSTLQLAYALPASRFFTNAPPFTVSGSAVTNLLDTSSQITWTLSGQQATPFIRSGAHLTNTILTTPLIATSVNRSGWVSDLGTFGVAQTLIPFIHGITDTGTSVSIQAVDFGTIITNLGLAYGANYLPMTGGTIAGNLTVNTNVTVLGSITLGGATRTNFNQLQTGDVILTNITVNSGATNFWSGAHDYRSVTTNAIPGLVADLANLNRNLFQVAGSGVTNILQSSGTNNIAWTISGETAIARLPAGANVYTPSLLTPNVQSVVNPSGFSTIVGTVGAANTFVPFYLSANPAASADPLQAVDMGTVISSLGIALGADYLPITGGTINGTLYVTNGLGVLGDTDLANTSTADLLVGGTSHLVGAVTTDSNVTVGGNLTLGGISRSSWNGLQAGSLILTNVSNGGPATNFLAGDGAYKTITTNYVTGLVNDIANLDSLINGKQRGSSVLTNVANLTGGTPANFLAGDGTFKTLTTNMVPGLVTDILNAAAAGPGGGGSAVSVNTEFRESWNFDDSATIYWDKPSPPPRALPTIKPSSISPAHLSPSTLSYFAPFVHNHIGSGFEVWLSNDYGTRGIASVAVGINARGSGSGTVAVGTSASATGESGTAIGGSTTASGAASFAAGYSAQATGISSISIGYSTSATGTGSAALGDTSHSTHDYSTSIGMAATTTATHQVRLGTAAETVSVPGILQVASVETIGGTNVMDYIASRAPTGGSGMRSVQRPTIDYTASGGDLVIIPQFSTDHRITLPMGGAMSDGTIVTIIRNGGAGNTIMNVNGSDFETINAAGAMRQWLYMGTENLWFLMASKLPSL
jgi:hypothetical protein